MQRGRGRRRGTSDGRSTIASPLGGLEEEDLLLDDGIVFEHAERAMGARADHGAVVAGQGHGDEADGDGTRFG